MEETKARTQCGLDLVSRFMASGMNVTDWCRMEGISRGTLYYWRRKTGELPAGSQDAEAPAQEKGLISPEKVQGKVSCEGGALFAELVPHSGKACSVEAAQSCVKESAPAAVIHRQNVQIELYQNAPEEIVSLLMKAVLYA